MSASPGSSNKSSAGGKPPPSPTRKQKQGLDNWKIAAQDVLENLDQVEGSLSQLVEESRTTGNGGKYGYVTREWGFSTPNGLGGRLGGKYRPWEDKLAKCKDFFWPVEAYAYFEKQPQPLQQEDKRAFLASNNLAPEGEQLSGNAPLHEFLMEAPTPAVGVLDDESDLVEYRTAARLMILLGTLSHMCGNSAPDPTATALPAWIEDPLRQVAHRLQVKPTLTGHFLVQENWMWRSDPVTSLLVNKIISNDSCTSLTEADGNGKIRESARAIVRTLLSECEVKDRRYRLTVYKNCFIGSQCVDVLVDGGFAATREEACHLGRRINAAFGLFGHVTDDHLLKDKMLFYRFRKRWRQLSDDKTTPPLENEGVSGGDHSRNEGDGDDNDESNNKEGQKDEDENCPLFSPKRLSVVSLRTGSRPSPRGSVALPRSSPKSADGSASDGGSAGADSGRNGGATGRRPSAMAAAAVEESPAGGENTTTLPESEENSDLEQRSSLELALRCAGTLPSGQRSFEEIAAAIAAMRRVNVKDRRFRLKVYRKCFLGSNLIDVLVERECATSRFEAVRIGREINQRYHLFEHVCDDHQLKDEHLFFRFTPLFQQMVATSPDASSLGSKLRQDSLEPNTNHNDAAANEKQSSKRDQDAASVYSASTMTSFPGDYDPSFGFLEEPEEFRFDNIEMIYPAFGNNHERVNQLIPACMGYALRGLPFTVIDILTTMRDLLEARLNMLDNKSGSGRSYAYNLYYDDEEESSRRLVDLLYQVASSLSRCKEQFQLMTTDPTKRTFNSIHVSIRQTQPLSNGVLFRRKKGGEPLPSKGTTGTQFPYFHLLDWLLGRYQYNENGKDGLIAQLSSVDACYPPPQREYIRCLSALHKASTLRSFLDIIGRPPQIMAAYNHLIECYAGEGGVLTAHCRKLYSYMHNGLQSSTSGTNHAGLTGSEKKTDDGDRPSSFADVMFQAMRSAADERWQLRVAPLMAEVEKVVYSTSESGGFTTVALNLADKGLRYEYGDVVRVLLPNDDKSTSAWVRSLSADNNDKLKLSDLPPHGDGRYGWGWKELWEALGWDHEHGEEGVPLKIIARYIEQAKIQDDGGKSRWVNTPLDLLNDGEGRLFAVPPSIPREKIASLVPVSPRIYSVSGVESDRVFLLVSKPVDGTRHHGYERMADPRVGRVHCSFAPATFFLVPPVDVNLVCVASGTGISPFVGLASAIGSRRGMYTIAHQCKSSDLFLSNSQSWLDFTALNPGAVVMGYISGDRSRRNCPMHYVIRNGTFEETVVLGRHNSSAYYFQCERFKARMKEVYKEGGLNLAYCCGGVQSAIDPLKELLEDYSWEYEFTVESYGVATTLNKEDFSCQIAGLIVDLDAVAQTHEGGDQILHRVHEIALEKQRNVDGPGCPGAVTTPDHSDVFWQLHPHAYNLLRCLRTPLDAEFEAFTAFLDRQNASKSVIAMSATKYARAALNSPNEFKAVRIASELQSSAIVSQVNAGDVEGATKSAEYLEALLEHIPNEDENTRRWTDSLEYFNSSFNRQEDM